MVEKKSPAKKDDGPQIPEESVQMMLAMGLERKKCEKALKSCDMNIERAIDWAFSHMDDPDSDQEMAGV